MPGPLTNIPEPILDAVLLAALVSGTLACWLAYRDRARLKHWGERLSTYFTPEEAPPRRVLWPLFLVSFAALYVEITMIRWIGTEVRIFAFFQNLALIACFLGFGLGCYWSKRRKSLLFSIGAMAALITLVEAPSSLWKAFLAMLSTLLSLSPDAALWGFPHNFRGETFVLLFAASMVVVAIFLFLLVVVMVPLGQWVGYYLDAGRNPIAGYSVNLVGSVAGLWIFAGIAFLSLPPEFWFSLVFLSLLMIPPTSRRVGIACLATLAVSLALFHYGRPSVIKTYWSPYQKLEVSELGDRQYLIQVNNTSYMTIANMTADFQSRHDVARRYRDQSSYDAPYRFAERTDRVLIVGAGAGNDAAAALRHGAGQVDAVEIDPVIYFLGETLHPEEPCRSPKVHKVLTDARAFLRQTREKYDVILFGLLDSHTQFSDYSNLRIDNFVYTEEAFREARQHLGPKGILVLKFEVRVPWTWMGQRFYATLDQIFGRPPIVFYVPWLGPMASATVFVTSDDPAVWTRAAQPELAALIAENPPPFPLTTAGAPPATTDDWPYVYHRSRSIPRTYLTISLILLGLSVLLVRGVLDPTQVSTWHFFLLGSGFLLLETQFVSRLALYFGTTWLVNCVALTAILCVLVVANFYVTGFRPKRLVPYYVLLLATLLANYFIPWQGLPYGARAVGVLLCIAYSLAVFFAGVVFTQLFRRSERKSEAFGANIVGAVAGGLAQNLSFIVGMKMLLVVAALFYTAAGFCGLLEAPLTVSRKAIATP